MAKIFSGTIAHLLKNPFENDNALQIIEDGAILVDDRGIIMKVGTRAQIIEPDVEETAWPDAWILPGLIDGHIHFPQYYATAAYGPKLLDWLTKSIFPMEEKLASDEFATQLAEDFTAGLAACGTTTSLVFGSQFQGAMKSLFTAAKERGLRMISGFTLMDRFGPENLMTTPEKAYEQAYAMIELISSEELLHYAVTPRFAMSCSPGLLEACRTLIMEFPAAYLQTHINENEMEIETTSKLFPRAKNYADIYHQAGLLTPRTILAHNIHASHEELQLIQKQGCRICHCPSSNNYLGSGLFPLQRHLEMNIPVFMGSDIGAGTHLSILSELGETYKVQQLQNLTLNAAQLLWLGTLAGANALHLEDQIGNFIPGKNADLVILSPLTDPYLARRFQYASDRENALFALLNLARKEHVAETVVGGRTVFESKLKE